MPEGVEITLLSQYLTTKIKGKYITEIEILSGKYKTKKELIGKDLLKGHIKYKVTDVDSKGKLLWITMKNNDTTIYLVSHLGLTGEWSFIKEDNDRVRLTVVGGDKKYYLCYNDPRNFGNIEIYDNYSKLKTKIDKLSPDVLKTEFTDKEFVEMVKKYVSKNKNRKDNMIYKVLTNQNKNDGIFSGIGNYLAPEILYNAKISPRRSIGSLSDKELLILSHSIKYIVKLSYYNNKTGYMKNFESFIDKHREKINDGYFPNYHTDINLKNNEFQFNVYRLNKDPYGNEILKDKDIVNGRTVYWVPKIQK